MLALAPPAGAGAEKLKDRQETYAKQIARYKDEAKEIEKEAKRKFLPAGQGQLCITIEPGTERLGQIFVNVKDLEGAAEVWLPPKQGGPPGKPPTHGLQQD